MYLIEGARIVGEGRIFKGAVLIDGAHIEAVYRDEIPASVRSKAEIIDADDCWLLPGVIDTHVHFRDPGFPEKGDFHTESRAAVAGGVTSVLDMPNTLPQTVTLEALEEKKRMASAKSLVNYGFFLGVTQDNQDELDRADYTGVAGLKLFTGASTGGMLVNDPQRLQTLFEQAQAPIVVHAEDEQLIRHNRERLVALHGDELPISLHSEIRSAEACFKASSFVVELAHKTGARLHLAHLSTEKELALLENKPVSEKKITAETCPQYLYFSDLDYERLGARIKCNPAVKTQGDRNGLRSALNSDRLDTIATDHAPHAWNDKQGNVLQAASGMPGIQFSLPLMLELAKQGVLSVEQVVEKMCHNPARIFGIAQRGFIRKGYQADLTIVHRNMRWTLREEEVLSRCGWSPYTGMEFSTQVRYTFVNGQIAYSPDGVSDSVRGGALVFRRD